MKLFTKILIGAGVVAFGAGIAAAKVLNDEITEEMESNSESLDEGADADTSYEKKTDKGQEEKDTRKACIDNFVELRNKVIENLKEKQKDFPTTEIVTTVYDKDGNCHVIREQITQREAEKLIEMYRKKLESIA